MIPPDLTPILATALDAVVVMRADGTVADWNGAAEAVFGWSPGEAIGRLMSEMIIPPKYHQAHEQGLAHYLKTGEGPVLRQRIEITALTRDGREIPVELSITPVEGDGEPVFLGFIRDISDRKQAEAALTHEKETLEREVVRREGVERQQTLLLAEMNHRVKNMLAVVTGVASQTARHSEGLTDFMTAFAGRLEAMSRTYGLVTASNWDATDLARLASEQIGAHVASSDGRFGIEGPEVALPPRMALSLSMVLHELVTNAIKHGAFSHADGGVDLGWALDTVGDEPRLRLRWAERGVVGIAPSDRVGFGSRMIDAVVRHELHGRVTREWASDGLSYSIDVPFPSDAKA